MFRHHKLVTLVRALSPTKVLAISAKVLQVAAETLVLLHQLLQALNVQQQILPMRWTVYLKLNLHVQHFYTLQSFVAALQCSSNV